MCCVPYHKAGHNLHAKFARKLMEMYVAGGAEKVPAELWTRAPIPHDDMKDLQSKVNAYD